MAHNIRPNYRGDYLLNLVKDMDRIIRDEASLRDRAKQDGLRFGIVPKDRLQLNNLAFVDMEGLEYDEKRVCFACKDICFITAVACECSQELVSCLRHYHRMCKCHLEKRFVLIWHDIDELKELTRRVKAAAIAKVS